MGGSALSRLSIGTGVLAILTALRLRVVAQVAFLLLIRDWNNRPNSTLAVAAERPLH